MIVKRKKRRSKLTLIIFFLLTYNSVSSQIIKDYCNFSKKNNGFQKKEFKFIDNKKNDITQELIYLGILLSTDNQSYKIFTSFLNLDGKGVSELIFVSLNCKVYCYRMNLPTDLPFKIFNNKLYFKNKTNNEIKSMEIDKLNDFFCTPFECF
jgi:hypothetical protein